MGTIGEELPQVLDEIRLGGVSWSRPEQRLSKAARGVVGDLWLVRAIDA